MRKSQPRTPALRSGNSTAVKFVIHYIPAVRMYIRPTLSMHVLTDTICHQAAAGQLMQCAPGALYYFPFQPFDPKSPQRLALQVPRTHGQPRG